MFQKPVEHILDASSGITFIFGVITGQHIAIFLGGLASAVAIWNHLDQIYTRKFKK